MIVIYALIAYFCASGLISMMIVSVLDQWPGKKQSVSMRQDWPAPLRRRTGLFILRSEVSWLSSQSTIQINEFQEKTLSWIQGEQKEMEATPVDSNMAQVRRSFDLASGRAWVLSMAWRLSLRKHTAAWDCSNDPKFIQGLFGPDWRQMGRN